MSRHGARFAKFGVIGALVFVAGTALQWPLVHPLGSYLSYLVQTVFSVELSYLFNRLWTWGDRETRRAFVKWNAQRAGIIAVNLLGYDLLVRLGMNWLAANLAVTALFTAASYILADRWSFASFGDVTTAPRQAPVVRPAPLSRPPWYSRLTSGPWLLLGILAVQAGLSLRLIWSNTAFNDEALYLWSGHWEIAHLLYGTKIPEFQLYFSGAPVLYPVLGAVADSYGGLAAARLLSLAFMLAATALCYLTARRLYSAQAAVIGAALFAGLGPVQYLGAFATYDAMALSLLVASACLVVHARSWWSEPVLIAAALVLVLGDATKYATGLWDPVVIAAAGLTAGSGVWWRDVLRAGRFTFYLAGLIAVALHLGGRTYLQGLLFTTLARAPGQVPAFSVLRESAIWIGLVLLIAMRGVVIAPGKKAKWLSAALVLAGFLAPLEQARIHTGTSLDKHVAFGAWFAAIAAGYVLSHAVRVSKYAKWKIAAGAVVAVAALGAVEATEFFSGWPDSHAASVAMAHDMAGAHGPVLADQKAVFGYSLDIPPQDIYGPDGFYWWDKSRGRELVGIPAYVAAIRAHYFSVVEIDGSFAVNRKRDAAIRRAVTSTRGYVRVTDIPWSARLPWQLSFGHGAFMIWRYEGEK